MSEHTAENDAPMTHYFDCGEIADDDVMASEPWGIDCPTCQGWL